jgi:hypothetical protein
MNNLFTFLRDVCGMKKITCIQTIESDLNIHYGWYTDKEELNNMYSSYQKIFNDFWNNIDVQKSEKTKTDLKFISPNNNSIYFKCIKLDFQKAFTTYVEQMFDEETKKLYHKFCFKTAKSNLCSSSKKFLYNYFLTNLLINTYGKDELIRLRTTVYEDVLYISEKIGTILKSEIDGAYIHSNNVDVLKYYYDVYGQFTSTQYKWLMFIDNFLIGKKNDNNVTIKGFEKSKPNVLYNFTTDIVSANSNKQRDQIVDKFIFNNDYPILDWAYKNNDGSSINLKLKNMNLNIDCNSENSNIYELSNLHNKLNRDVYLNEIKSILSFLYETIG